MKNYSFNVFSEYAVNGIVGSLKELNPTKKPPIIVCIGSDLVLGDSLGPLIGTFLRQKSKNHFVYGTLNEPVTAKEVNYAKKYLKEIHPKAITIAVDAAIGQPEDVGLIKVSNKPIKPGLGVNKNLNEIGDISIMGIVATKSIKNYNLYNLTRLNLIYKMANVITNGLCDYLDLCITAQNPSTKNDYGANAII